MSKELVMIIVIFTTVILTPTPIYEAKTTKAKTPLVSEAVIETIKVEKKEKPMEEYVLTAYSLEDEGVTGITKMGVPVEVGHVAVDPQIIPLGSKIYIEGMGEYHAVDTGGAIKGRRIDVFMESRSEAIQFGRQRRMVRVVE